jgi:hypothetical protein
VRIRFLWRISKKASGGSFLRRGLPYERFLPI